MVDQIIDKRTIGIRGLRGPTGATGSKGDHGIDAAEGLPQDEAVAGWVSNPRSATNAAIALFAQGWNRVPPNTNDDVSDLIQAIIDAHPEGMSFPAGVYHIAKPLRFPYNTPRTYAVNFGGCTLVPLQQMDELCRFGDWDAGGTCNEKYRVSNGVFDGVGVASIALHASDKLNGMTFAGQTVERVSAAGIRLEQPAIKESNDAKIFDYRFGNIHADEPITSSARALELLGIDNIVSGAYITNAKTAIYCKGILQVSHAHIFNNLVTNGLVTTTGIYATGSLTVEDVYFDATQICLNTNGIANLKATDLFAYVPYPIPPITLVITSKDSYVSLKGVNVQTAVDQSVNILNLRDDTGSETKSGSNLNISDVSVQLAGKSPQLNYDAAFSGSNKSGWTVTQHRVETLAGNTGMLIGYAPCPSVGSYSAQTLSLTDDASLSLTARLKLTNLDGATAGALDAGPIGTIDHGNADWNIALFTRVMLENKPYFPIYLYPKHAYTVNNMHIRAVCSETGMLFSPLLTGSIALTSNIVKSTTEPDGKLSGTDAGSTTIREKTIINQAISAPMPDAADTFTTALTQTFTLDRDEILDISMASSTTASQGAYCLKTRIASGSTTTFETNAYTDEKGKINTSIPQQFTSGTYTLTILRKWTGTKPAFDTANGALVNNDTAIAETIRIYRR